MGNVLLIIQNKTLRQLYHELLQSKHVEVVAVENVTHAILLLTIKQFTAIIIYTELDDPEVERFLRLRLRHVNWQKIAVILLTTEKEIYKPFLTPGDIVINDLMLTPQDVAAQIKTTLAIMKK